MPQASRVNSGYVLKADSELYQFDCGGGVSSSFRRFDFDPLAVRRIIISHTHADHISDLPLFVQMLYLAGRKETLIIHLPEEAIEPVKNYFSTLYLFSEKIPFKIEFIPIMKGSVIDINGLTVHAILNTHLIGYTDIIREYGLANKMQCFSYLIQAEGKSMLYSADLGSEKDLGTFLTDLDILVVESTHIDLPSLLDIVIDHNVQKVVLTHTAENYDTNRTLSLAQKSGYDNLIIAEDGMTIDL